LISRQQQIQNLRKYIVQEIQEIGLKRTFINSLRRNNQVVSGKLVDSILAINYQKSGRYLKISSGFNKQTNMLTDIRVDIQLPWGKYGNKLDVVRGRKENARGERMSPSTESILKWMDSKGNGLFRDGLYRQRKQLKSGSKMYVYPAKRDSYRKSIAFRIARKINRKNELETRRGYSNELNIKVELAVIRAFERYLAEYSLDFLNDFTLQFQ
jgi:hypothetical protein